MLGFLVLIAAALAVYANSFAVPFVLDDVHAIVGNTRIRELWPGPLAAERPVTELTFALNHAVHGLAVGGYHAVNLLLHLACGLLVLDLARRTLLLRAPAGPARSAASLPPAGPGGAAEGGRAGRVAWWAALLFLVHPLQTEAVTYVTGRSEVLMAFWYLATLDLFLVGETKPGRRAACWAGAVVTCALGMATKPVMVTAPVAAFWLARCLLRQPMRDRVSFAAEGAGREEALPRRWPVYAGLASTWVVLAYLVTSRDHPGAGLDIDLAPADYLRTQLGVTWHYLRLLVWPTGQTLEYDWPLATRWLDPAVLLPALGWLALLALLAGLVRAELRVAAFWLGFALLVLLPSSSVIPIADLVFEHRMYLSVAGVAVLAALAGDAGARRAPRLAGVLGCAVVLALGVTAHARNALWRDPIAFWEDALAKAPHKQRIYRSLARVYEEREDHAGAARVAAAEVTALEHLVRVRPRDPDFLTSLGNAYVGVGRVEDAVTVTAEATRLAPEDAIARAAYGGTLLQLGRAEDAVTQLEVAQALAEGRPAWVNREVLRSIRTDLGWAYATVGRLADALRVLRQAEADEDVAALNNLGSILGRLGQWEEARRVLERARALDPSDPNVMSNLGWVFANAGRLEQARALLEEAIRRRPGEPSAHGNLGWVRLRAGDPGGALNALAMAQALQPQSAWVATMLGIAHARLGEWDAAVEAFERAERLAPGDPIAQRNLASALRHELPPPNEVAP